MEVVTGAGNGQGVPEDQWIVLFPCGHHCTLAAAQGMKKNLLKSSSWLLGSPFRDCPKGVVMRNIHSTIISIAFTLMTFSWIYILSKYVNILVDSFSWTLLNYVLGKFCHQTDGKFGFSLSNVGAPWYLCRARSAPLGPGSGPAGPGPGYQGPLLPGPRGQGPGSQGAKGPGGQGPGARRPAVHARGGGLAGHHIAHYTVTRGGHNLQ